jgi:hypothetical protein
MREIKTKIFGIIILMTVSAISAFGGLIITVEKDKKGFYCVRKEVLHFDQFTSKFIVDSAYTVPLPYKIVEKDTIYDITDYVRSVGGTYFFLSDGTPASLNVTYTKSDIFKAEEKCAELEAELEIMHQKLQNAEKARQEADKNGKKLREGDLLNGKRKS